MKYRNYTIFSAAIAATLVFASCSRENTAGPLQEVRFTASVGTYDVKATDTAFETGDVIGLYCDGLRTNVDNLRLTVGDASLNPAETLYWDLNQLVDDPVRFNAYYPYDNSVTGYWDSYDFMVSSDQTSHANYTMSDLMTAVVDATPAEGAVNLRFVHRMTQVLINIDNRLGVNIKNVMLGDVYAKARFPWGLGDQGCETEGIGARGAIAAGKLDGRDSWVLVLPPQDCTPLLIITTTDGKQITYEHDYQLSLSPARRYNVNLIVDETAIVTEVTAEVVNWIENGDLQFSPRP